MCRFRVQLNREHVAFLRFLLEGYDGLATTTTIDRWASIVDLLVPQTRARELRELLDAEREQLEIISIVEGVL